MRFITNLDKAKSMKKTFHECNFCKKALIDKYMVCNCCVEVAWCTNKCKKLDLKHNKYCSILSYKIRCSICDKNKFLEKQDCNHMFCFDCLARRKYTDVCNDKTQTLCPICSKDITTKQLHYIEDNYETLTLDYIHSNIESFFSFHINPFYLDAISYIYYINQKYDEAAFILEILSELYPNLRFTVEHNLKVADVFHSKRNTHISNTYYLFSHLDEDMISHSIFVHTYLCGYTKKTITEYKKAVISNRYEMMAMWICKEHSLFLFDHFNGLYKNKKDSAIIKILVNIYLQYCMNMYISSKIDASTAEFEDAISLTPYMLDLVNLLESNDVHTRFMKASLLTLIPEHLTQGGHILLDLLPELPECGLLYARLGFAHLLESHSEKSCTVASRFLELAHYSNFDNMNYLKLYSYALFLNCKRRKILSIMLRSQKLYCTVPCSIYSMFYNTLHN